MHTEYPNLFEVVRTHCDAAVACAYQYAKARYDGISVCMGPIQQRGLALVTCMKATHRAKENAVRVKQEMRRV